MIVNDFPLTVEFLPYQREVPFGGFIFFQPPFSEGQCGGLADLGGFEGGEFEKPHGGFVWVASSVAVAGCLPASGSFSAGGERQKV